MAVQILRRNAPFREEIAERGDGYYACASDRMVTPACFVEGRYLAGTPCAHCQFVHAEDAAGPAQPIGCGACEGLWELSFHWVGAERQWYAHWRPITAEV